MQLGAFFIDPWSSRVHSMQFADYAIIDRDPGPRALYSRVGEVARLMKTVLGELVAARGAERAPRV